MYTYAPNFRADINKISAGNVASADSNVVTAPLSGANVDTVKIRSRKEINIEKLQKLFPNGELQRVYDEINKDFGIDRAPHLRFVGNNDGVVAGGFTYSKNEISMSLEDLVESDTKIVGIKDGKRTVLTSPKNKLPLFVSKQMALVSVAALAKNGNLGYDKLIIEPLTEDEHKKFIVQKIAHEVVHAQQHMVMRQTEGIGEKEIIAAWTHAKPQNMIDKAILGFKVKDMFDKSYWADKPETEKTISPDSEMGQKAKEWLEAVRNYPKVDSPEYEKNAIEVDAYNRSAEYADKKFGPWEG